MYVHIFLGTWTCLLAYMSFDVYKTRLRSRMENVANNIILSAESALFLVQRVILMLNTRISQRRPAVVEYINSEFSMVKVLDWDLNTRSYSEKVLIFKTTSNEDLSEELLINPLSTSNPLNTLRKSNSEGPLPYIKIESPFGTEFPCTPEDIGCLKWSN